jgi:dipeptidyl aminopeptidase/acylaminoacyl peptidase
MAQSVSESDDEDNPFGDDEGRESKDATKLQQITRWLKQELEMEDGGSSPTVDSSPMVEISLQRIPVFLGHGSEDEKASCELGRQASVFLKDLEVAVCWNEYEGLGHWYSSDMLRDMVQFVRNLRGWRDDV